MNLWSCKRVRDADIEHLVLHKQVLYVFVDRVNHASRKRVHCEGKSFLLGVEDKEEEQVTSRGLGRRETARPDSGLHTSLQTWMEHAAMLTCEADDLVAVRFVDF